METGAIDGVSSFMGIRWDDPLGLVGDPKDRMARRNAS
jgi:hypothetical protein